MWGFTIEAEILAFPEGFLQTKSLSFSNLVAEGDYATVVALVN